MKGLDASEAARRRVTRRIVVPGLVGATALAAGSHRAIISILALLAAIAGWTPRHAQAVELLVSDPSANAVLSYSVETGAFIGVFASGGGLTEPGGLTFGPDGNLYVGSLDNTVKRYDGATGAFIDSFASGGGLSFPGGLTFGPDGNLYVAGSISKVLRYQGTTGEFIGRPRPRGGARSAGAPARLQSRRLRTTAFNGQSLPRCGDRSGFYPPCAAHGA
jgi:hypothetical protein